VRRELQAARLVQLATFACSNPHHLRSAIQVHIAWKAPVFVLIVLQGIFVRRALLANQNVLLVHTVDQKHHSV
jgi:hypothetical protein